MKKLTTAKIWQFAQVSLVGMLSGIISNWLVYFYQPDETAISQGRTYLFHRDWWCLAFSLLSEESQPSGEFLMLLQIL